MNSIRTILAALAIVLPVHAHALSWTDAIAANEARAEELWQLAKARGLEGRHIGSVYNELHATEHRCSIIGRMLGKADLITDIERSTEMDVSDTDGQTTGVAAHSLDNWGYSARSILKMNEEQRIREWNLDCVGHLDIPGSAYIDESGTATFYEVDGTLLKVIGDVEAGFADKIKAAIIANPQVMTVALGSAGGSVHEAITAGMFIRERGLETTLYNNCYSACTIVFVSGVKRLVWSPYPELGFHQISRGGVAIPLDDDSYSLLEVYATAMGVVPGVFVALTKSAPPSGFTTPEVMALCDMRIATWVQRACF